MAQDEAQVRFEYTLNSLSASLAHHHLRAWPLSGCYTETQSLLEGQIVINNLWKHE